ERCGSRDAVDRDFEVVARDVDLEDCALEVARFAEAFEHGVVISRHGLCRGRRGARQKQSDAVGVAHSSSLMREQARYSEKSYTIFNVPAMKNGRSIHCGLAYKRPANTGAIAAPVVRATPVIPAAAERSSGRTIAIVYACRVGTSIWLMLK